MHLIVYFVTDTDHFIPGNYLEHLGEITAKTLGKRKQWQGNLGAGAERTRHLADASALFHFSVHF